MRYMYLAMTVSLFTLVRQTETWKFTFLYTNKLSEGLTAIIGFLLITAPRWIGRRPVSQLLSNPIGREEYRRPSEFSVMPRQ